MILKLLKNEIKLFLKLLLLIIELKI
jgi:hypothetical protein